MQGSFDRKQISQPYFDYIYRGIKPAEGRIKSSFWNKGLEGKTITIFSDDPDDGEYDVYITQVNEYTGKDIEESRRLMLEAEGYLNLIPDASNIEQALEEYRRLAIRPGKTMVAVHMEVVDYDD